MTILEITPSESLTVVQSISVGIHSHESGRDREVDFDARGMPRDPFSPLYKSAAHHGTADEPRKRNVQANV